jgi:hypothetical protein
MKSIDKSLCLVLRPGSDRLTRKDDAIALEDPATVLVPIADDGNMGSVPSSMYVDALLNDLSLDNGPIETDTCSPKLTEDVRRYCCASRDKQELEKTIQQF